MPLFVVENLLDVALCVLIFGITLYSFQVLQNLLFHGRYEHCHITAVKNSFFLCCANTFAAFFKFREDFRAKLCVAHFSAAESYYDLNLIAAFKETVCVVKLRLEIVLAYRAGKLDFFNVDNLLFFLRFFSAFFFFKAEFAIVHYFANGRNGAGREKNQVKVFFGCKLQSLCNFENAEHFAVVTYDANFRKFYFLVDKIFFRANGKHLHNKIKYGKPNEGSPYKYDIINPYSRNDGKGTEKSHFINPYAPLAVR